jgi:hypothetical protein
MGMDWGDWIPEKVKFNVADLQNIVLGRPIVMHHGDELVERVKNDLDINRFALTEEGDARFLSRKFAADQVVKDDALAPAERN